MQINISRQYIYLIVVSLFLLIFVFVFSFAVLIPEGKEYRIKRVELKKTTKELRQNLNFHDETLESLKELQRDNRAIITAFDATFNPERFEKKNRGFFSSLHLEKVDFLEIEDEFAIYEVNTTSQISSPQGFYDFLDSVNKSDWIVGINFPINFKREDELIKSSFTMKVYSNNRDKNSTASESVER